MPMDRRKFLKLAGVTALGSTTAAGVYPFLEARWCRLTRQRISLPKLPSLWRGTTVAFVTDVHHGPYVPLSYVRHVVAMTNALKPDIVVLGGDYVSKHRRYIPPVMEELGKLKARLGRFAVLGNHDNWESQPLSEQALGEARIDLVDNTGIWVEQGGSRLRIGGVGDLWTDHQDLSAALGDATEDDPVILLSHNPDFAETLRDRRVGLILSGHTHGGQVVVPVKGAPLVPSRYGQKYLHGLVRGPSCQVFISRGVGTSGPPVRFLCRPEVVLMTLV